MRNGSIDSNLDIDHIDGNSKNNKIENLREATLSQNCQNQKIRNTNTSGTKGVWFHKQSNKIGRAHV